MEKGKWFQRNWKQILMMWFALLLSCLFFGWTPVELAIEVQMGLIELLKIGMGSVLLGGSAEVIADKWNRTD